MLKAAAENNIFLRSCAVQMSSWRRIRCPRTGQDYRAVLDSLSMICLYQQLGGVVPGTFFHGFLAARTHRPPGSGPGFDQDFAQEIKSWAWV